MMSSNLNELLFNFLLNHNQSTPAVFRVSLGNLVISPSQLNTLHSELATQMADRMIFPMIQFREKDLTGRHKHLLISQLLSLILNIICM